MKFCRIAIFILMSFAYTPRMLGFPEGSTNHGGDGLGITFERARGLANQMVKEYLQTYSKDPLCNSELRQWYETNAKVLGQDIITSPHRLIHQTLPHEALTKLSRDATIEISRPAFRKSRVTLEDAAMLLIHESVHHLHISDETFANYVAARIGSNWEAKYGRLSREPRITPLNHASPQKLTGFKSVMMEREIFYWGGDLNEALIFDPTHNKWRKTSKDNQPTSRQGHTLSWSGAEVIIWGGTENKKDTNNNYAAEVVAYNPKEDRWRLIPIPTAFRGKEQDYYRAGHQAFWTGKQLLIVGGSSTYGNQDFVHFYYPKNLISYNPSTNNSSTIESLLPRDISKMKDSDILWTGQAGSSETSNRILFFDPLGPSYFYNSMSNQWKIAFYDLKFNDMKSFTASGMVDDQLLLVAETQLGSFPQMSNTHAVVVDLKNRKVKFPTTSVLAPIGRHKYAEAGGHLVAFGSTSPSLHIFDFETTSWRAYQTNDQVLGACELLWTGESFIGGLGEFRVDLPK